MTQNVGRWHSALETLSCLWGTYQGQEITQGTRYRPGTRRHGYTRVYCPTAMIFICLKRNLFFIAIANRSSILFNHTHTQTVSDWWLWVTRTLFLLDTLITCIRFCINVFAVRFITFRHMKHGAYLSSTRAKLHFAVCTHPKGTVITLKCKVIFKWVGGGWLFFAI